MAFFDYSTSDSFEPGPSGDTPLIGAITTTAMSGYALEVVNTSVRSTDASTATTVTPPTTSSLAPVVGANTPDPGTLIQVPPNQDHKIPVVYGRATVAGIITDAVQSDSNRKMTYVVTISELTGNLMSSGFATASTFHFNSVRMNDQRIVFKSDGITASYTTDRIGNVDKNAKGLVKVWCFAGGSHLNYMKSPEGYTAAPVTAYSVVPGWDANKNMSNLVFAVVEVTYNKEKNMTGLPVMTFEVTNTLSQPGDCLCDYFTNTLYGCSIAIEDILVS